MSDPQLDPSLGGWGIVTEDISGTTGKMQIKSSDYIIVLNQCGFPDFDCTMVTLNEFPYS